MYWVILRDLSLIAFFSLSGRLEERGEQGDWGESGRQGEPRCEGSGGAGTLGERAEAGDFDLGLALLPVAAFLEKLQRK